MVGKYTNDSILLLDIDGVINHGGRFSSRYAKENHIPLDTLAPFFEGVFQQCLIGQADLRSELQHVLPKWRWSGSVDELLDVWFHNEVHFDQRVLDLVLELKSRGIKIYGASNQEHHRAKYLLEHTDLKKYINEFFISAHLGVKKPESQFYQKVINEIKVQPEDIMYWDDDEENVEGAKQRGIRGHLYTDFATFQAKIHQYFHT